MIRPYERQQSARYAKALYNYKIGHPVAAAKTIFLLIIAVILLLTFLSLLSYGFGLMGF